MWADKNLMFEKCGRTDEVKGTLVHGSALNRLTVANTGSEDGSVAGAQLMYKDK